jgi:tripartite-type tricarboxylate transporter receptor subunit TctC
MKRDLFCFLTVFFIGSLLMNSADLFAAPYYEKKALRIVVGFAPGGGYDRISRILARYLPKYIPGNPTIVVENMEGAGSIIASNYLYNAAKPDGLTIGIFTRGTPFSELYKFEGVKFETRKFSWIGSAAIESTVLTIKSDSPYKTFQDLLKSKGPVYLAIVGPQDVGNTFPMILKEFLGLNPQMVTYIGRAECMLAIERREVDGGASTYSSIRQHIDRGLVRPLIRGRVSEQGIENLPVDEDQTTNPKAKALMALRSTPDRMGRPFVAPPGTPSEVMNILREAFAKVAKDPQLQAEAKKFQMTVEYVPAEECLKMVDYIFNQPADIIKEFSKYVSM